MLRNECNLDVRWDTYHHKSPVLLRRQRPKRRVGVPNCRQRLQRQRSPVGPNQLALPLPRQQSDLRDVRRGRPRPLRRRLPRQLLEGHSSERRRCVDVQSMPSK